MIKSIIVAKSENNVIGKSNDLVWHLPTDQRYFKKTTYGHFVIMGRKTFESLAKPLPGRVNIIISRKPDLSIEGAIVFDDLHKAFEFALSQKQKEVFILGGGEIYKKSLPEIDKMYITEVAGTFDGDTFFPEYNQQQWQEEWREKHLADPENPHDFDFVIYSKK